MIKNNKRVNKVKKQALVCALVGMSCLCFTGSVLSIIEGVKRVEDMESYMDYIRNGQSYVEHVKTESESIYDDYKSGNIDAKEYQKRLDNLNSDDYIIDNGDEFLDKTTYDTVIEKNGDVTTMTGLGVIALCTGSTLAAGAFSTKYGEAEQDQNCQR